MQRKWMTSGAVDYTGWMVLAGLGVIFGWLLASKASGQISGQVSGQPVNDVISEAPATDATARIYSVQAQPGTPAPAAPAAPNMQNQTPAPNQGTRQLTLRMVDRGQFCRTVQGGLAAWGTAAGFDQRATSVMASSVTAGLVDAFRSGRGSDYIDQAALVSLMRGTVVRETTPGYLPLAAFLAPAIGTNPQTTTVALSAGELRFIPFAQKGMDIVVIAQSAAPLTPERARNVTDIATRLGIKLSVVWIGADTSETKQGEERDALAFLAAVTGGSFVDLSGDGCAQMM